MTHFALKNLFRFALGLLLLCAFAQGALGAGKKPQAPADAKAQPAIRVDDRTYIFGELMEGAEVEHTFAVRNTGKEVLNIDRVRVS